MWSCYSDTLLKNGKIPNVTSVLIFADKDASGAGQEKAEALAARLRREGKFVDIYMPPLDIPNGSKSMDWLDTYNLAGPSAFSFRLPVDISVNTGGVK